ncbi:hypothetical protein VTK73DRAFT_9997 [Phialemonium thermophilum]|uniref:Thioredoxin domain-containing protein n=1 Tax=Phialemonium thermophilum TaxID=223376 RepID=A0ABR3Y441_9PEZI
MRFYLPAFAVLPLLAAAADGPFEQYKAQFQNFLSNFGSVGSKPVDDKPGFAAPPAAEKAAGEAKVQILTLDNWKDTLYGPVRPDATDPEEWWVLITGRNKTCFGHCTKLEAAFDEAAQKFATFSKSPHTGLVNCDDQPVLCNSWAANVGTVWVFEMLPPPAPVNIYRRRFNMSSTTADDFVDLYAQDVKKEFYPYTGYFHPFDGPLAKNGLAVPIGYVLWAFNAIPSWAMMLGISFLSRSMMNRRMGNQTNGPRNNAAPPPRAGPAGGARP